MKPGDLVRAREKVKFMTTEEWNATGIIIQVLDGGSHRKNTSYEVLWGNYPWVPTWHTSSALELVK